MDAVKAPGIYCPNGWSAPYKGGHRGGSAETMMLYSQWGGFPIGGEAVTVETWYFRCSTCGLVLPANRHQKGER